jgi:hypothetical protein
MDTFTEYQRSEILKAAAELRRLAGVEAEVSQLRADANNCGSGAGCCYQAAQNERLETELQQAREERTALLVNEQNLREELAALRASLGEPVFWFRPVDHGAMYEGPVHHNSVGGRMLREEKPGEWVPLFAVKETK